MPGIVLSMGVVNGLSSTMRNKYRWMHSASLIRQALREAKHIQVDVDGTTVKLNGTVHSWQERDTAQGVAWSAPGVRGRRRALSENAPMMIFRGTRNQPCAFQPDGANT